MREEQQRAASTAAASESRAKQNKTRLLKLLKYFETYTDEEHKVTTKKIVDLTRHWDTHANRKTVKDDIDALVEEGYDIVTSRSYYNSYFMGLRTFEVPEIKLLIDAVSCSRFITKKKSKELIKKLMHLTSRYQAQKLVRYIYTDSPSKPVNEDIYYTVDAVNDAIGDKRKVTFQYYDYSPKKERVLRHDGEVYLNSPYTLLWDDDRYYMVGWSEKYQKIVHFRVDRMVNLKITDEEQVPPPEDFSIDSYASQVFHMFPGDPVEVTLECDNEMMRHVVDQFGENVETRKWSSKTFRAFVKVYASPTFFSWVFQFGAKVRIISPTRIVDQYQEQLWASMQVYR
ncbi:MAG: WYL domain-containing protein [Eubacteriales bacterium]|nr:WYL domain-containing protein [Eubacteriales bacterium]